MKRSASKQKGYLDLYSGNRFDRLLPEQSARNRRIKLFGEVTRLERINLSRAPKLKWDISGARDHWILWTDGTSYFLTNEPYQFTPVTSINAITVPHSLSPYCGKWDSTPGAQPWTTCTLICQPADRGKLLKILELLKKAAGGVPPWNIP